MLLRIFITEYGTYDKTSPFYKSSDKHDTDLRLAEIFIRAWTVAARNRNV